MNEDIKGLARAVDEIRAELLESAELEGRLDGRPGVLYSAVQFLLMMAELEAECDALRAKCEILQVVND